MGFIKAEKIGTDPARIGRILIRGVHVHPEFFGDDVRGGVIARVPPGGERERERGRGGLLLGSRVKEKGEGKKWAGPVGLAAAFLLFF